MNPECKNQSIETLLNNIKHITWNLIEFCFLLIKSFSFSITRTFKTFIAVFFNQIR